MFCILLSPQCNTIFIPTSLHSFVFSTTLIMLEISSPCYRNDSSEAGEVLIEAGDWCNQQLQDTPKRVQEAQRWPGWIKNTAMSFCLYPGLKEHMARIDHLLILASFRVLRLTSWWRPSSRTTLSSSSGSRSSLTQTTVATGITTPWKLVEGSPSDKGGQSVLEEAAG